MAAGPTSRARTVPRSTLVVGAVAVVLVAVLSFVVGHSGRSRSTASAAPSTTPSPTATTAPTTTDVYKKVSPSVVVVQTAAGALGSGVIATAAGTIVTANHVVADKSAISVLFADGTTSAATIASADPTTDIATLTPTTLPQPIVPVTLGGAAAVGSDVVAIGNPLGLAYSVSTGVVSGTDRAATTAAGALKGLIQFDASVNVGSSGGPLLDANGTVIGIVVSFADPAKDGAFAGIGFAEPIGAAVGGTGPSGTGDGPQI